MFELTPAFMQDRFGIPIRLFTPFENQITGGPECHTVIKIGCHIALCEIIRVLFIDHRSHTFEGVDHLIIRTDAM